MPYMSNNNDPSSQRAIQSSILFQAKALSQTRETALSALNMMRNGDTRMHPDQLVAKMEKSFGNLLRALEWNVRDSIEFCPHLDADAKEALQETYDECIVILMKEMGDGDGKAQTLEEAKLEVLNLRLNETEEYKRRTRIQLAHLSEELRIRDAAINELTAEKEKMYAAFEDVDNELRQKEARIASFEASLNDNTSCNIIQRQLEAAVVERDHRDKLYEEECSRSAALSNELRSCRQQLQEQSADMARLQQELLLEQEKTASLEAAHKSSEQRIEGQAISPRDDEASVLQQMKIDELAALLDQKENAMQELEAEVEEKDDIIESLKARVMHLRERSSSLNAVARRYKRQRNEANAQSNLLRDHTERSRPLDDGPNHASSDDGSTGESVRSPALIRCQPNDLQCVQDQHIPVPLIERQGWRKYRKRLRRVATWSNSSIDRATCYSSYQATVFALSAIAYTYGVLHITGPGVLTLAPKEIKVIEKNIDRMARDLEAAGCEFSAYKDIDDLAKAAKDVLCRYENRVKNLKQSGRNVWRTLKEKKELGTNNLHEDQHVTYAEIGFFNKP